MSLNNHQRRKLRKKAKGRKSSKQRKRLAATARERISIPDPLSFFAKAMDAWARKARIIPGAETMGRFVVRKQRVLSRDKELIVPDHRIVVPSPVLPRGKVSLT